MALTGVLFRRDTKTALITNPPVPGEMVFATDTGEHGWLDDGFNLIWKRLEEVPAVDPDTVIAPAGVLPVLDGSNLTNLPVTGPTPPVASSSYYSVDNANNLTPNSFAGSFITVPDPTKWYHVHVKYTVMCDNKEKGQLFKGTQILTLPPVLLAGSTFIDGFIFYVNDANNTNGQDIFNYGVHIDWEADNVTIGFDHSTWSVGWWWSVIDWVKIDYELYDMDATQAAELDALYGG